MTASSLRSPGRVPQPHPTFSHHGRITEMRGLGIHLATCTFLCAQMQTGPPLPYRVVEGWPQLPAGWNFGEVAAVDVDKNDNVWVFSDGPNSTDAGRPRPYWACPDIAVCKRLRARRVMSRDAPAPAKRRRKPSGKTP